MSSEAAKDKSDALTSRARKKGSRPQRRGQAPPAGGLGEGTLISGRYRLERVLAQGGMGSVWAGRDQQLDRPIAIKFMDPEIARDKSLQDRFKREARAAARLRTPHVVQIHEFGVDQDLSYIIMERLEGEDLQSRLRRLKRLAPTAVVAIANQAARALEEAREAGIIHRDLKPGNIFLARQHDDEIVKILDFGVAKMLESEGAETTKAGVLLGSPQYVSPEQARGEPVDHRSDLWSLAAILFRALTGKLAFSEKNETAVIMRICMGKPEVPSAVQPELPAEVDQFFAKAFRHDPDHRFQNARQLSRAFAVAAGVQPEPSRAGRRRPEPDEELGEAPTRRGDSTSPVSRSGVRQLADSVDDDEEAPSQAPTTSHSVFASYAGQPQGRGLLWWLLLLLLLTGIAAAIASYWTRPVAPPSAAGQPPAVADVTS